MRTITRILMTVTLASFALPSLAVKLIPGTYRLTWEERRELADPLWQQDSSRDSPRYFRRTSSKVVGAKSRNAVCGIAGSDNCYPIVLDESKGTGKGFDVIYIGSQGSYGPEYRVADMTGIPLVKNGRALEARGYLALTPGAVVSKAKGPKRRFDIRAVLDSNSEGPLSVFARGAWYGYAKTGGGKVAVRLLDNSGLDAQENIMIGCADTETKFRSGDSYVILKLGVAQTFDDELYKISFNPANGKLTVADYTGPTGLLIVNPVNGFGKQINRGTAWFTQDASNSSMSFSLPGRSIIKLPPGFYGHGMINLCAGRVSNYQYLLVELALPKTTISSGTSKTITAGGPIKFKMSVETNSYGSDSRATSRSIVCTPMLAGFERVEIYGANSSIALKDGHGNTVFSQAGKREDARCPYYFKLPTNLKPGTYTALLTVNMRPYDNVKTFAARLRIE